MKRILATLILVFTLSLYFININMLIQMNGKTEDKKTALNIKKKSAGKHKSTKKHKPSKKDIYAEATERKEEKRKNYGMKKSEQSKQTITKIERDSMTHHRATWYKTEGTRVHRDYPTAAYNHVPRGTMLLVTNVSNNKSCTVEVTDRNGMGPYHIDLSHSAFGYLSNHSRGAIKVLVKIL
jgi:rare lipoprotein A (peptidoglycan hydrolase)